MGKKILFFNTIATIAVFIAVICAPSARAVTATISNITVTDISSTAEGANNVTYTATMSLNSTLPSNTNLTFGFMGSAPREQWYDLSGATVSISGASGSSQNHNSFDFISSDVVNYQLSSQLGTGTKTITISGVRNPSFSSWYTLSIEVRVPGTEGPGEQFSAVAYMAIGNFAVKGQIKMPDGSPASGMNGIGVNLRTADFSQNFSAGVNENGYYSFSPVNEQGTIQTGVTYFLEVWPGRTEGVVSPDPVSVTYNGTTITKNLTLVTAAKTIKVTVKYGDGSPVTTANVWANKNNGSGVAGGDVDSKGEKTLSVSGGSWNVNVNCGWNQETNSPKNCDWMYSQPPMVVNFANNSTVETANLNFVVTKATAVIKGKVLLPDGRILPGGFVDIRTGDRPGSGTGINNQDGSFIAHVPPGDYKINISPDNQNPALARYYSSEIGVRVSENETKDLGTIVMKEKTSSISGMVVDKNGNGVGGVWINSWVRNGSGWGNTYSAPDGSFVMYVFAGEWELRVDTGRNENIKYIPLDSRPVAVSIGDNQAASGMILSVQRADATINVKLVSADGLAITNMYGYAYARRKSAMNMGGSEFGSGIDRGMASISLLGGETYVVGMHMPPEAGNFSLKEEVEVTIAADETKDVRLTLIPNDAFINGFVKDQYGNLVTNADAEVFAQEEGNWSGWKPTALRSDGSFSISVRGNKNYMVGVRFRGEKGSTGYVDSNPRPGDRTYVPTDGQVVKIITAFKADSVISGIVLDPSGNPIPYAWVGANNFRQMEGKVKADVKGGKIIETSTQTRSDGTFSINIIAGEFSLFSGLPPEFQNSYMPPKEVTVTVTPTSPATSVVMQYRQADAFVVATAIMPDGSKPDMGFCHAWQEAGGFSGKEIFGGGMAKIPLSEGSWYIGCDTMKPGTQKFYRSQEQLVTVKKGDLLQKTFNLEEGLFEIPQGYAETFSATAQKVITLPDGTTVSIPANALGTEGNVTFTANPDTKLFFTKDTKPVNFAWNFEALDSNNQLVTSFNSNVNICIPYNDEYLDKIGVGETDIVAKYYNDTAGAWQLPDGVTQDTENNIVCFSVSHFTNFALATSSAFGTVKSKPAYVLATPLSNGGPQVTIWDVKGNIKLNFFAYVSNLRVGIQALSGDVNGDGADEIIVVPGAGAGPQVSIFDKSGHALRRFFAFASHIRTGLRLAVADVDGDGADEIIVTTMTGAGPQIRIFDGEGNVESQFFAYASSFRGGVNLATGDVDGDGVSEIITVPQSKSAPHIRVFNNDGLVVSQFYAFSNTLRGEFHLAIGDVNGDGVADVVVTPGPGFGPQVAMFDGEGNLIRRFFAYATTFRGGINVSVGDVNGDGENEIIATPQSNAGPQIRVFNTSGTVLSQFFAYYSWLRGSFTSVIADIDQDGVSDIVTAPGQGMGPQVRVFDSAGNAKGTFFTHHRGFRGGLNISSVPVF